MIRIGVLGVGGRMGQAIVNEVLASADMLLVGGVERAGHQMCGSVIGNGLVVGANAQPLAHKADVLVDFTSPGALAEHLRAAMDGNTAIVIGTTGLEAAHQQAIDEAARSIAVLQSPNMSVAVNLLAALVERAAQALGPDYDIEIAELHHRYKVDAPSGTALFLGEAAARGRGGVLAQLRLEPHELHQQPRAAGGIGFATLRGGSSAGEHKVVLAGDGERLELAHIAENREIFARGAVRAAQWLHKRKPGRYFMSDLFANI